eukprot:4695617-Alexandrium_andersonii.AAC.1
MVYSGGSTALPTLQASPSSSELFRAVSCAPLSLVATAPPGPPEKRLLHPVQKALFRGPGGG